MNATKTRIGTNIEAEIKGNKLILEIDLSQTHGESSSGKSIVVATSGGNQLVGKDGIKIGINAYKPNK